MLLENRVSRGLPLSHFYIQLVCKATVSFTLRIQIYFFFFQMLKQTFIFFHFHLKQFFSADSIIFLRKNEKCFDHEAQLVHEHILCILQLSQSRMADFPAFIASKNFDLWNHHIPQIKWLNLRHTLMYKKMYDNFGKVCFCKPDWWFTE